MLLGDESNVSLVADEALSVLEVTHATLTTADARAHAVTDSVASAQDVAAMFLTSLAFKLLCLAKAWAEETILYLLELPLSSPHASLRSWLKLQRSNSNNSDLLA